MVRLASLESGVTRDSEHQGEQHTSGSALSVSKEKFSYGRTINLNLYAYRQPATSSGTEYSILWLSWERRQALVVLALVRFQTSRMILSQYKRMIAQMVWHHDVGQEGSCSKSDLCVIGQCETMAYPGLRGL
jgi:hypothetical protein